MALLESSFVFLLSSCILVIISANLATAATAGVSSGGCVCGGPVFAVLVLSAQVGMLAVLCCVRCVCPASGCAGGVHCG